MSKNIFLCTDGTWMKKRKSNNSLMPCSSNVAKIHEWIKRTQKFTKGYEPYYDEGVGTGGLKDKIIGGITGKGLEKNIIQAYEHISKNYKPGDKIFGFGFSRGAYTIRVVSGIVCKYGIPVDPNDCKKIYQECYKENNKDCYYPRYLTKDFALWGGFYFLGVWDTVGALGIPSLFAKSKYEFMDLRLSQNVLHAVHAVSVDEKRRSFIPTLWTNIDSRSNVEQKWFSGDHCGVGGGHEDTRLSDVTLKWVIDNLLKCAPFLEKSAIGVIYSDPSKFNPDVNGKVYKTNKWFIVSRLFPYHRESLK